MEHCNDFKFDLMLGQITEKELADILTNKKIEVKDDSAKSFKTGNVFIEFESRGKASGIATTQSDFYAIKTSHNSFVLIETQKLKQIARKHIDRIVLGGDNNTSKGVLIPRCELL